jgi:hypothetical protein
MSAFLKEQKAAIQNIPEKLIVRNTLSATHSGEIQKFRLREMLSEENCSRTIGRAGRTRRQKLDRTASTRRKGRDVWTIILNVEREGVGVITSNRPEGPEVSTTRRRGGNRERARRDARFQWTMAWRSGSSRARVPSLNLPTVWRDSGAGGHGRLPKRPAS